MKTLETILKEFDQKFTHTGDFGEKKFNHFMVSEYKKSDPIIPAEDNEIVQLKSFLQTVYQAGRDSVVEDCEGMKYDADKYDDIAGEAIANHAYADKFEAFRYGYNEALIDVIEKIKKHD